MSVILGIAALSVDIGRVQSARAELQTAADAAARYAITGLQSGTALTRAQAAASESRVDGRPLTLQASDVQIGRWVNGVFTATATSPNAVRVTAVSSPARNNAVTLTFASMLGLVAPSMSSQSVASMGGGGSTFNGSLVVDGKASSFYAGMPGSQFVADPWGGDQVSSLPSAQVTQVPISPGNTMTFTASGWAHWHWSLGGYIQPEGFVNQPLSQQQPGDFTGISTLTAPCMGLVGVFLTNNNPRTQPTPPSLNFSTDAARNYDTINPSIGQTFYIGDGVSDNGVARKIVVPPGATRLFLGTNDSFVWRDNGGDFSVNVSTSNSRVSTVK